MVVAKKKVWNKFEMATKGVDDKRLIAVGDFNQYLK